MAKKIKQVKETLSSPQLRPKSGKWYTDRIPLGVIAGILLCTFIIYSPSLSSSKEFTNWDDPVYVVEQPLITHLDAAHTKALFTEPVSLNYHPVTMVSLALNYYFSQLNPFGYFFTNILFHLFNTFLVFVFLYNLSGRKFWIGAVSALLFGIHPMHVESVAWISERKDVLYCFFFLGSCISYLRYLETKQMKMLVLCFVLFLLSCLSKAMAAPLPVVLLLIDFYRQRKFSASTIIEKIPFFILSLIMGYLAVRIQSQGAIADLRVFTISQRFMFASYGFVMYIVKLFVPTGLSTFYPYPLLEKSGDFSWFYKLQILFALTIIVVPGYLYYRKGTAKFRLFVFGVGFFVVMVAMVLQFISVGKAIMADRYTYVSYIGLFFILASLIQPYIENAKTKTVALGLLLFACTALAITTYGRVQVWQNSGVLWTDVITQYPYATVGDGNVFTVVKVGVDEAYKNRGNFYREHGDIDKAMADYAVLVRVHSQDEDAYSGLANFYAMKGQFDKALELYSESLEMKPGKLDTYKNRSITYSAMDRHKEALRDLDTILQLYPSAAPLYQRDVAFEKLESGMWNETIADCDKLITANPNDGDALFYRGTAFINITKYAEGIRDLAAASKIKPTSGNIWFNLSFAYNKTGDKVQALQAALNAQKNGFKVDAQYLQELNGK